MSRKIKFFRGDTLVEVMFAVGIFGIIAVSAISLMNRGLNSAQAALETTMARNEIDAQAEALRFIHDSYASEKNNSNKEYSNLWEKITNLAIKADDIKVGESYGTFLTAYPSTITSCARDDLSPQTSVYPSNAGASSNAIIYDKSFVLNTHKLDTKATANDGNKAPNDSDAGTKSGIVYVLSNNVNTKLTPALTYPRLIFDDTANLGDSTYQTNLTSAQGIWVTAVKPTTVNPQFYDFYIRTCWDSPGRGTPITISTTIRLYNPGD